VLTTDGAGATSWINAPATITTDLVPYTGATAAVNLGAFDLQVNGLTVGRGAGNIISNSAIGFDALISNTTGANNTANGANALQFNTTGAANTANGAGALFVNSTGLANTANGSLALQLNTTGNFNTANGAEALRFNTTGNSNTANGSEALRGNTIGLSNTASGKDALFNNTTGNQNTALGRAALISNTTGSNNTALGFDANVSSNNLTNATAIGSGAIVTASNTIQLGNTSVTNVITSGDIKAKTFTMTQPTTITSGATTLLDFASGNLLQVSLGSNVATLTVLNATVGTYLIKFTQDATGSKTVAFPAAWKWSGGTIPTITTTANRTDIVTVIFDGSTYYAAILQNF
jgi:hypothetical protein